MTMMTWGHMRWVFFPIPLACLAILTLPAAVQGDFDRTATALVGRVFFKGVRVGPARIALVHLFVGTSLVIFSIASSTLNGGFDDLGDPPCDGEDSCTALWYRRASRYRAERNFWLSLLTLVLWLLVYKIFALKGEVVALREGGGKDGPGKKGE